MAASNGPPAAAYGAGQQNTATTNGATYAAQQHHQQPHPVYFQGPPYGHNAMSMSTPHDQHVPPRHGGRPGHASFDRNRRRCTWMSYVLRQLALIVPFVIIVLNINVYAWRRGRYFTDTSDVTDPVYTALWLTVPLSGLVILWGIANIISMRRAAYRGGIPPHVQFGIELLFALGSPICWILLLFHISSKKQRGYYEYPFLQYEAALAAMLGLLMVAEFGLCARALFEFHAGRKRREQDRASIP